MEPTKVPITQTRPKTLLCGVILGILAMTVSCVLETQQHSRQDVTNTIVEPIHPSDVSQMWKHIMIMFSEQRLIEKFRLSTYNEIRRQGILEQYNINEYYLAENARRSLWSQVDFGIDDRLMMFMLLTPYRDIQMEFAVKLLRYDSCNTMFIAAYYAEQPNELVEWSAALGRKLDRSLNRDTGLILWLGMQCGYEGKNVCVGPQALLSVCMGEEVHRIDEAMIDKYTDRLLFLMTTQSGDCLLILSWLEDILSAEFIQELCRRARARDYHYPVWNFDCYRSLRLFDLSHYGEIDIDMNVEREIWKEWFELQLPIDIEEDFHKPDTYSSIFAE